MTGEELKGIALSPGNFKMVAGYEFAEKFDWERIAAVVTAHIDAKLYALNCQIEGMLLRDAAKDRQIYALVCALAKQGMTLSQFRAETAPPAEEKK